MDLENFLTRIVSISNLEDFEKPAAYEEIAKLTVDQGEMQKKTP